ncbi:MAG: acetate--CoA ligase family protein [Candidatus Bathyarchaeota archaeon]|nr:acetate--CoA ligase family protein [Candidatus Bathyarchaeota archaeon]
MKLEVFLKPRSIAVVGASREPKKVGHRIFRNLIDSGFQGELYPINPKAEEILGFKCYSNVTEVPGDVDLAVIAVPVKIVPLVAEQCGMKGVKGIVVISAGFSETGIEGTALERKLLAVCRKYKMHMQGPNCLGIINTQSCMNASFAAANPSSGNIAFVSQSGALGSSILNWALQNDVGFTSFISLGNEADLTAVDFLEALGEDKETKAIGLYIEGVKEGDRFIDVASKLTRKKPVIALKAGTTDVGVRAVSSHTGSLAGSDTAFSAAFRKTGTLRVDTLEELFNLVLAFEDQPLPTGENVLVVTNGGGPGILTADACEKSGLDLPRLEYEIREELRKRLPPHASLNNPVDVLGDADECRYKLALEAGLKSRNIDGIVVILTPQAMTPVEKIAEVIAETRKISNKPIMAAFMGLDDDSLAIKTLQKSNIPNYVFPESAAHALKRMHDYHLILRRPSEEPLAFSDVVDETVKNILSEVRRDGRLSLTTEESLQIAAAYGIATPRARITRSRSEAAEIADSMGYPVVMKVVSPEILHKTDVGGVVLNVNTREEVERRYDAIVGKVLASMPRARILGVLIQSMAPWGREVIVGAVRDIQFGPLMMFGLGGIYVNFLRDVSYRLCPLTRSEAREMIEETKAYTLLRGVRGEPPSDIESVIDVLLRVSQIMSRFEEIVEMEVNPLFVYEETKGCSAVDIRITISK